MATKTAGKQDTKSALLQAGIDIMLQKGYSNTGLQEVLASLGMPKGSFYHYFQSKEEFALEIIRQVDAEYSATILRMLRNPQETPLQRLKSYCLWGEKEFLSQDCRKGCLIGNLSQEMSDQSEVLRKELASVMEKRVNLFARCIEEGQESGEITKSHTPKQLAETLINTWGGTIMHAKTVKTKDPIDSFMTVMFDFLKAKPH